MREPVGIDVSLAFDLCTVTLNVYPSFFSALISSGIL